MSSARTLYEQFKKERLHLIKRVVAEKWQESLVLDFKTLEKSTAPMTKQDRKNLAEALSGFANSDGGIIIWGIDARPYTPSDPDTAKDFRPVDNLSLFLSEVQRDTAHVVSPGIIGVEHFPISDSPNKNSGYVVTFVPKGEGEPHMARAKDQHRFYYRSGTSFLPMEPFMVADRYGRRPQPKLEIAWRVEGASSGGNMLGLRIVIGIENSGLGIALYPAIVIHETPELKLSMYGLDGNRRTGLPERLRTPNTPHKERRMFAGGSDNAIHPGSILEVTCMERLYPKEVQNLADITVKYELYCEGFSANGEEVIPLFQEFQRIRGF